MRWFTSDPHFHHKNVIEFCNRPFPDVSTMNEKLIENWNARVAPEDTIYILGDMFFCGKIEAKRILELLQGKKILISGNHDWKKIPKHRAEEFGFSFIQEQHCIRLGNKDVLLSHFPYLNEGDHTELQRFPDKRYKNKGSWLLHGHVHCLWKKKNRMINVGVDVWDYAPVSETELLSFMEEE